MFEKTSFGGYHRVFKKKELYRNKLGFILIRNGPKSSEANQISLAVLYLFILYFQVTYAKETKYIIVQSL